MALDDKDIFEAICKRYADQPIEFIMEQYEKAKRLNLQIERRLGDENVNAPAEPVAVKESEVVVEAVEEVPHKKYTRRDLKVKPQNAITEECVICCLCGAQRQSLTATHLATHDISVEEYKKLCGYAPNQKLMSGRRLAKSKEIIGRAQKARLEKIASQQDDGISF